MSKLDEHSPEHAQGIEALSSLAREVAGARQDMVNSLLNAYRQQGYGEGYHRAISEVLSSLVAVTEDFIRHQKKPPQNLRALLYSFVEHLDHRIRNISAEHSFVEGGLGI